MAMIQEKDQETIRTRFQEMDGAVTLVTFTQTDDPPQYATETVTLMQELATLSDKINVVVHDFKDEGDKAEQFGVEQVPAIVVEGTKDYGVRYYGFPGGYEFPALLEDIIDVSKGESGLSEQSKERLSSLTTPVHLRVFSTPT